MGSSHSKHEFKHDSTNTARNRLSKPRTSSELPRLDTNNQILSTSSVACLDVREPRAEAISRLDVKQDVQGRRYKETGTSKSNSRKKSFFRRSKKPYTRNSFNQPNFKTVGRYGTQQHQIADRNHHSQRLSGQGVLVERPWSVG